MSRGQYRVGGWVPVTGEPAKAQLQEPVTPLLSTIPPASGSLGADSGQVSFPSLRGHPCDLPGRRTLESKQPLRRQVTQLDRGAQCAQKTWAFGSRTSPPHLGGQDTPWGAWLGTPHWASSSSSTSGPREGRGPAPCHRSCLPSSLVQERGGPAQEDEGGRPFAPSLPGTGLPAVGGRRGRLEALAGEMITVPPPARKPQGHCQRQQALSPGLRGDGPRAGCFHPCPGTKGHS